MSTLNGAGQGPAGAFNHLAVAPGQRLLLGASGGTLLLSPPGAAPGSMAFSDMRSRVWHLLRENGPSTGQPAPVIGQFSVGTVSRDLNLACAEFISQTGIAPALTERYDTFPVFAGLDQPVPPGLVSLVRIDYNPYGQQTYKLDVLSEQQFDNRIGGVITADVGQPYVARVPIAGYVRLQPQPGLGQSVGPGSGTIFFSGSPAVGATITVTLSNGTTTVVIPYIVTPTDTLYTIPAAIANLIGVSAACVGGTAYLYPPSPSANTLSLVSLQSPGTSITYAATIAPQGVLIVSPAAATNLAATGDTMTWQYSSLGTLLIGDGDTPTFPPQFHMAPVYRVLADYWPIKNDLNMARWFLGAFDKMVARGKSFYFDQQRATQDTLEGDDQGIAPFPLNGI